MGHAGKLRICSCKLCIISPNSHPNQFLWQMERSAKSQIVYKPRNEKTNKQNWEKNQTKCQLTFGDIDKNIPHH